MKRQLFQIIFLALFWIAAAFFSLYVPFWSENNESSISSVFTWTSWTDLNNDLLEKKESLSGKLSFLLPFQFQSSGLVAFFSWFQQDFEDIVIVIDWYDYPNLLMTGKLASYDIALLPYEMLSGSLFEAIEFQEDLSWVFHPVFSSVFQQRSDFLPFALDPLVTFSRISLPAHFTLSDFWNYLQSRKKKNRFSLPFFWIHPSSLLSWNNAIFAFLIQTFLKVNDVSGFSFFVDNYLFSKEEGDLALSFLEKVDTSSELCLQHPLICLFSQGLLDLYFDYYSTQALFSDSFPFSLDKKVSIATFPYYPLGYPMRAYGFVVIPEKRSNLTDLFLLEYLQTMFKDSDSLQGNAFSAFKDSYFRQCQWEELCAFFSEISLITLDEEQVSSIVSNPLLSRTLQKKYDPSLFFRNTSL